MAPTTRLAEETGSRLCHWSPLADALRLGRTMPFSGGPGIFEASRGDRGKRGLLEKPGGVSCEWRVLEGRPKNVDVETAWCASTFGEVSFCRVP